MTDDKSTVTGYKGEDHLYEFQERWEDHLARYHAGYDEESYGCIEFSTHFYGGNVYIFCNRCGDLWVYKAL